MTLEDLKEVGWTQEEIVRAFCDVLVETQEESISLRVPAANFRGGLHYDKRRAA